MVKVPVNLSPRYPFYITWQKPQRSAYVSKNIKMYTFFLKMLKWKNLEGFNFIMLTQLFIPDPFYFNTHAPFTNTHSIPPIMQNKCTRLLFLSFLDWIHSRGVKGYTTLTKFTSIAWRSENLHAWCRLVEYLKQDRWSFQTKPRRKKGQGFTQTLTWSPNKSLPTIKYTHSLTLSIE